MILGNWTDNVDDDWYTKHPDDTTFAISEPGELAYLAKLVNEGINFTGKTIKLDSDIDLSEHYWVPIGNHSHKFNGTFDGQNNQIKGMFISERDSEYVGLFGQIGSNCALNNITILGKIEITLKNDIRLGGICGYADGGSITNCHNSVNMSISSIDKIDNTNPSGNYIRIGGIIGSIENSTAITNCSNNGDIAVDSSTTELSDMHQLGGIVGEIHSTTGQNTAKVIDCYNDGNISNKISKDDAYCDIGGVCGWINNGLIINCYNSGLIKSISTSGTTKSYIGGLIGYTEGLDLVNSYSIGNITVESDINCNDLEMFVGGLIGYSRFWGNVFSSYNLGDIEVTSNARTDLNIYIGGIIGYFKASSISCCYNIGNISVETSFTTVPDINSDLYLESCSAIGGIVGFNYGGEIQNCYNSGKIVACTADHVDENISKPSIKLYLGGLIGYSMASGNLINSYNIGIINVFITKIIENIDESSLDIALGGITGKGNQYKISNCYNISVASSPSSIIKCGGILGYESNVGTLIDTYCSDGNLTSIGNKASDDRVTKLSNDGMRYLRLLNGSNNLNNGQESKPWSPDIFGVNDGYPVLADVPIQISPDGVQTNSEKVPKSVIYIVTNNEESQQENYLKHIALATGSKLNTSYQNVILDTFNVINPSYSWKEFDMKYPPKWINTSADNSKNSILLSASGTYCGVITYDVSEKSSTDANVQPISYHYTTLSRTVELKDGLVYDSNDGSGKTYSVLPDETGKVTVEDNMFHYDGHAFVEWKNTADESGKSYKTENELTINSGSIILYAQWEEAYTVTIYVSQENATIIITDEDGKEIKPEKDGTYMLPQGKYTYKVFKSGYITSTKEFTVGDLSDEKNKEITISVDLSSSSSGGTPVSYNVTYNANGGSGTLIDVNSPYHSGVTVLVLENNFTKDGCTFKNWNTKADGSGTSYSAGDRFSINSNISLYAQWEEVSTPPAVQKVTVTFYIGNEVYKVVEVNKDSSLKDKFPVNPESSDSDSNFKEWNTKEDASGTAFTADSIVNEDTSVYAVWEKSSSSSSHSWWWIIIIIIILIIIAAAYYYYKKNQN